MCRLRSCLEEAAAMNCRSPDGQRHEEAAVYSPSWCLFSARAEPSQTTPFEARGCGCRWVASVARGGGIGRPLRLPSPRRSAARKAGVDEVKALTKRPDGGRGPSPRGDVGGWSWRATIASDGQAPNGGVSLGKRGRQKKVDLTSHVWARWRPLLSSQTEERTKTYLPAPSATIPLLFLFDIHCPSLGCSAKDCDADCQAPPLPQPHAPQSKNPPSTTAGFREQRQPVGSRKIVQPGPYFWQGPSSRKRIHAR